MAPNKNIFCNSPWYELQIYWDGGLGICCQESHRLADKTQFNIANTTIKEWFNSEPVRKFRKSMLGNTALSACSTCYKNEAHNATSRRIRNNQKSVIFAKAFEHSYYQSPGNSQFAYSESHSGYTITDPIDIHIDLGNYCNLACKMCDARASSVIAVQEIKWGNKNSQQYVANDWTRNSDVWQKFKNQLLEIPKLNNLHFMGGETLLTDKFEDLVDWFIEHKRFDVCFSFVSNGTVFQSRLLEKLSKFRRVGIEVSIESLSEHNSYQRQGTDTNKVLTNIAKYGAIANGSTITVTLRPAVSALTIGNHVSLLEYARDNKFVVKTNYVYDPEFLSVSALPYSIRLQYLKKYQDFLKTLIIKDSDEYNASDPNQTHNILVNHTNSCIELLSASDADYQPALMEQLVQHCSKWDKIYNYDAKQLYPELKEYLELYGY